MASIVEKYEQILAADPRSRIFVELARALVDRGEAARAIAVCQQGLEHHPSSILGRVTWGRALLEGGDPKGAMDQFEIAIALEPANPYAYNHVAEALLRKELHREALPVLARAAELQPADARIRGWLEDAKRRANGEAERSAAAAPQDVGEQRDEAAEERGEPSPPDAAAAAGSGAEPEGSETPSSALPDASAPPDISALPDASAGTPARPERSAAEGGAESKGAPEPSDSPELSAHPDLSAHPERSGAEGGAESKDANAAAEDGAGASPSLPPPLRPDAPRPPPLVTSGPRSILHLIPDETARDVGGSSPGSGRDAAGGAAAHAGQVDAEKEAEEYERTLRKKLLAEPHPPPSFLHRHRRRVLGGALVVALLAAAAVYQIVSSRNAALEAAGAAARARVGLARDTRASLREAHRLLSAARERSSDPEIRSLAAQVAAVLATEHGDEAAGEVARALVESGSAGDGALAASWLLARSSAERDEAEAALLAAPPSAEPLVQALAGRILLARGEIEGGRGRLEIAARASPPLLRALSDLGDSLLASGDAEGALEHFTAALGAHATHPRSIVGAAEARLALGRDLDVSRRELERLDGEAGSAPPVDLQPRFVIALARVRGALGEPGPAAALLARAAEKLGETARLAATVAELQLQARAWEKAEAAALRAMSREPREAEHRVLLARARIGRGRFQEAIAATEGVEGRAVRLQRAIARYRLGQWSEARAELAKTARDGKVPGEAAVWYALVEVASGNAERALSLLEKLTHATPEPPLARVALGRALEALGRRDDAEAAYRAAAEHDPLSPEPHVALGRILLASGRAADAIEPLERAVKLDPSDVVARRALGEARLAVGQAAAARADLDVVVLASPKDAAAHRLLSAAWLEEGQPREARLAADRALGLAPKDPATLLAAARAAQAAGDAPAARHLAQRAMKTASSAAEREEAKRIAGALLPRKR